MHPVTCVPAACALWKLHNMSCKGKLQILRQNKRYYLTYVKVVEQIHCLCYSFELQYRISMLNCCKHISNQISKYKLTLIGKNRLNYVH